ncbi:WXG100 family type VII secretion target [Paenibacillus sp. FSL K6-0108]|uniref:WXG100 family type VII secretion target n=1 Tax=Paenibacillus sp. FSL K6-0108 TaxID=2921417 RepID=UPI00324E2C43
MQRIEVHPDVLEEKAWLVQQKKLELERMVRELEKSIYLLQSEWSGVTGERFFWDFMQVKEVFPTTLGILDKIQNEFIFIAKNFRTADGSGEVALYMPEELKRNFAVGLLDKSVGETITGIGQTAEALFYNPFGTLASVAYAMTVGKVVDVGRGIGFAWDAAWGNGTARSDIEQFVDEQKKQINESGAGYYGGTMTGQALAYVLFGKAFRSMENKHTDLGGSGGKAESGKDSGLTIDSRLRMEGNKTIYPNQFGNEISWTKQGSKDIDAIIEKNLKSSKAGDVLEGKVAQLINETGRLEGTGIELKMQNKKRAGDIDVLTDSHIIEVKKSLSALDEKQLDKLTNPINDKYFNFDNKEVIFYIEDVTVKNKTQADLVKKLSDLDIKLISSLDELKEVMSK